MALSRITRIADPRRRAEAAAEYLRRRETATRKELASIRKVRDAAVDKMLDEKTPAGAWQYKAADVARAIGVARSSVSERFPKARART